MPWTTFVCLGGAGSNKKEVGTRGEDNEHFASCWQLSSLPLLLHRQLDTPFAGEQLSPLTASLSSSGCFLPFCKIRLAAACANGASRQRQVIAASPLLMPMRRFPVTCGIFTAVRSCSSFPRLAF